MNTSQSPNPKVLTALIFTALAALIFALSNSVSWLLDDYFYRFNFALGGELIEEGDPNPSTPIATLYDVFQSQCAHYLIQNGRFVAHTLVQTIDSFLPKPVFALLNAGMWILLITMLMKISKVKVTNVKSLLTCTLLTLLLFNNYYQPAYQVNYIWMGVLSMLFIYMYLDENIRIAGPLLFLICLIIGDAQETYNVGIGGALIIYNLCHFKSITSRQWWMFFGFGIGALALCLAPGTIGRTNGSGLSIFYTFQKFVIYSRVLYVFVFLLIYYKIRKQLDLKQFFRENEFAFYILLVCLAFNWVIGIYCNRQLFGAELMSLILTMRLLKKHSFNGIILSLCFLGLVWIFIGKFQYIAFQNRIKDDIEAQWLQSPDGRVYNDDMQLTGKDYTYPCMGFYYDNFTIKFFGFELKQKYGIDKPLIALPKHFKDITADNVKNEAYEIGDGRYFIVQDKAKPARFIVDREYRLFGITHPKDSYEIEFNANSPFNTDYSNVLLFNNSIPFVNNIRVRAIPSAF